MVERRGEIVTRQVKSRRVEDVVPTIIEWVKDGTRIHTDKGKAYGDLNRLRTENKTCTFNSRSQKRRRKWGGTPRGSC